MKSSIWLLLLAALSLFNVHDANGFHINVHSRTPTPVLSLSALSLRSNQVHNLSIPSSCSDPDVPARTNSNITSVKRRKILNLLTVSTCWNMGTRNADAAQTVGEAVRKTAANIPGYGQPDVFYPSSFVGKWKATRVVVTSDDPYISQLTLPATFQYDVRFITVDGDTASDAQEKVIADRQFNEVSFYNAIRAQAIGPERLRYPPSLQSITWSPYNPNVCTSHYSDASTKEIKVTKRAAELDFASGIVSSSEYRRITTVSSGAIGGIPSISASRMLAKWKTDGVGKDQIVEGIEIVYADGNLGGDPMTAGLRSSSSKPQMTSKSRLKLEKAED